MGCHTKRTVTSTPKKETTPQPTWHTRLIQGARAVVTLDGNTYQGTCSMWAVNDSLTILSVMPMLGIEMFRAEATPKEVVIVDKINKRYLRTTYAEINRYVTPKMSYTDLQNIATGEVVEPLKKEADIHYSALGKTVSLRITYPTPQTNVPINTTRLNITKYQSITLDNLLP